MSKLQPACCLRLCCDSRSAFRRAVQTRQLSRLRGASLASHVKRNAPACVVCQSTPVSAAPTSRPSSIHFQAAKRPHTAGHDGTIKYYWIHAKELATAFNEPGRGTFVYTHDHRSRTSELAWRTKESCCLPTRSEVNGHLVRLHPRHTPLPKPPSPILRRASLPGRVAATHRPFSACCATCP